MNESSRGVVGGGFTLLIKDPLTFDPAALARVLAPLEKTPVNDVVQRMKLRPGVVGAGLNEEAAGRLASVMLEKGIETVLFPDASLPMAAPPQETPILRMGPEGVVFGRGETEIAVGWEKLRVISVNALRIGTVKKVIKKEGPSPGKVALAVVGTLVTGIPFGIGKSKKTEKIVHESDTFFFADVLVEDHFPRLRIDPAHASFAFLAAEKTASAVENFRLVVKSLARFAPSAVRNRAADLWINNRPMAGVVLDDENYIDEEWRWLSALAQRPGG